MCCVKQCWQGDLIPVCLSVLGIYNPYNFHSWNVVVCAFVLTAVIRTYFFVCCFVMSNDITYRWIPVLSTLENDSLLSSVCMSHHRRATCNTNKMITHRSLIQTHIPVQYSTIESRCIKLYIVVKSARQPLPIYPIHRQTSSACWWSVLLCHVFLVLFQPALLLTRSQLCLHSLLLLLVVRLLSPIL